MRPSSCCWNIQIFLQKVSNMLNIKKRIKNISPKTKEAILSFIIPVPACALLGLLLGACASMGNDQKTFWQNVATGTLGAYFCFGGAALGVHGLLLLLTKPSVDIPIGISSGLYYGTFAVAEFLGEFITTSDPNRYSIAFVIVALICYIIWLKHFKKN